MSVNWVGVRNFLIIAGIAGLVFISRSQFNNVTDAAGTVVLILFVAAIGVFAYNYFRQHQLAWLVMKTWQRWLIIVCGSGIAILVVAGLGFGLFVDQLTPLGIVALIGVLALVIAWVIRESRRFRI